MPTLKIDGIEVTVDRGTTLLKAAHQVGIEIPTFCYHPGLSIAANCRMCLVETNKAPKPLPACHATVMDGMEVWTNTPKVIATQQAVLEFILLNHPVDCPICDQAGECVLQDNYRNHSLEASRLYTKKVHKPKAKRLGPTVTFDAERCILCTRCVRFCEEVTKTVELQVVDRGEHSEITTFPGKQLDNPYTLNVVEICPVGALTSSDFRFKRRVWFLQGQRSVCTHCSRGCNIRIDAFRNTVERQVACYNPKVNDWWLCDEGRLSHHAWTDGLVKQALDRTGGGAVDVTSRDAADRVAEKIAASVQSGKTGKKIAFVLNPSLPLEDNWTAVSLANGIGGVRLFMGGATAKGSQDDLLKRADRNANRRGLEELLKGSKVGSFGDLLSEAGSFDVVVVLGSNHDLPDGWKKALGGVKTLAVLADRSGPLSDAATVVLPAPIPAMQNGTVVNFEGRVQRVRRAIRLEPAGVVFPHWRILKRIARTLGHAIEWSSEEQVFADIAARVEGFKGMTYEAVGDYGLVLGSQGEPDIDPKEAARKIDRVAPQWRSGNVNSRMPWSH